MFKNKTTKTTYNPLNVGSFFGISTGCFFGTGYGLIIGFGKVRYNSNGTCVIYPCRNPFLHGGFLTGCYCGIAVGFGFGNSLANTIGITKKFKLKFPSHSFILFNLIKDKK